MREKVIDMEKINCQFWGKLIRQSTKNMRNLCSQLVTWGGGFRYNLSNKITFFRYVIRAG